MSRDPGRYLNRELSWLEFNQRVIDEAADATNPLLERLRFLSISGSNLDEFFMVRVGGLVTMRRTEPAKRDAAGMTAAEQLAAISRRAGEMMVEQSELLRAVLLPALVEAGIRIAVAKELTQAQADVAERRFVEELQSRFTPMRIRADRPFPLLRSGTLNVAVRFRPDAEGNPRLAVIPFGPLRDRFLGLPSPEGTLVIPAEAVVERFVDRFFPGEEVLETAPFRISRNADVSVRDELSPDLVEDMEQMLEAREEAECVRLVVAGRATRTLRDLLRRALKVPTAYVYELPEPLDMASFGELCSLPGFDHLRWDSRPPQPSPRVDARKDIFSSIRSHDVLLVHPFESFDPVVRLVEEAAADPDVIAVKQVLYRTARDSRIAAALKRAAQAGKNVTALVELKARFDEARNIGWARDLERAGVQVIYGVEGLKTHAKACVVIRREPAGIRRYVHFGTGNYNEVTARLYTDVGLLTADEDLGFDAVNFFNALGGYSQAQGFRRIAVAPFTLRDRLVELVHGEIERKKAGLPARVRAKFNSLSDPAMVELFYEASAAGVPVELNVRGICCLRPGVKGLSETIRVTSIVGRYLEHARIFHFHQGGDDAVWIGSADLMSRNLDRRVELLVPVEEPTARRRLMHVLDACLADPVKGRELLADGGYRHPSPAKRAVSSQDQLYEEACDEAERAAHAQLRLLKPHRAEGA